ncbi:hypothetical protein EIN_111670 [Entamoeba invadens IP1]|uniref:t-SNARE coiled-coil homology domain-containing protein n=1 Tax=Entamoeba invadens IP1 TaxID=370355 RepID=A0A0A1TXW0_ENTIV|nr:hypothetical protein EIN_111670 [Entamoeba invadens IP1]ELP86233.1 hypothetical protein EIN_111670 [Entamoeba invadens IP1]|eukprot:XP_004185579.1 hypothetical protein EIN_111670 [Entamoeba invadens IP1]
MSNPSNEEILLNENDDQIDSLQMKTQALRKASKILGNKVVDSSKEADATSIEMEGLVSMTNHSIDGVSRIVGAKVTYRHCFFLICGIVVLLLILYGVLFKMDWGTKPQITPQDQQ